MLPQIARQFYSPNSFFGLLKFTEWINSQNRDNEPSRVIGCFHWLILVTAETLVTVLPQIARQFYSPNSFFGLLKFTEWINSQNRDNEPSRIIGCFHWLILVTANPLVTVLPQIARQFYSPNSFFGLLKFTEWINSQNWKNAPSQELRNRISQEIQRSPEIETVQERDRQKKEMVERNIERDRTTREWKWKEIKPVQEKDRETSKEQDQESNRKKRDQERERDRKR